jgi:hypothetical protein
MDSTRFDDLTKALATATSRRQALKTIAATTLGSILGLAGIGTAFAKCHDAGHNCEENSTCCSHLCCTAAGQTEGVCCANGLVCQNGTCVTPKGNPTCLCNSGAVLTGGCRSPGECELVLSAECHALCGNTPGAGGLKSATCVPC